ncbi:glycosyl hydrolase family 18 protein [Mediterranea massiliensis]|uniref:glycosyl hydrolase family 18 protein n=1 Tax=Mediterranea massiliensis TaxID=1841865 RepID=UPI0025A4344D|nr:glycosyl hydrolase family 18 protein [Mediterranea massiliensis]MDM8336935.1 glycosyl hydrolase family 18 protein [Mediterranea massiliensis]
MKHFILYILLIIFCSCYNNISAKEITVQKKIVFGYLQYEQLPNYQIPWEQLTHLSIAFARATEEGYIADIDKMEKIIPILQEGQRKGVKVLLSVGGGGNKAIMGKVLLNEKYRNCFKSELINIINKWNLDGLDIDYELWTGGSNGYGEGDKERAALLERFYQEIREELPKDKLLTAAVSADCPKIKKWGNYNVYNATMFQYLDFINIMIYDFTGGWKTSKIGQHASMEHFVMAAKHWSKVNKIPKDKIILGVPFYGVKFLSHDTPIGATHISYKNLLKNYPNEQVCNKDDINNLIFYNGKPTIRSKAKFVIDNEYGGIAIWTISQDSQQKVNSLLQVIYEEFQLNNK